MKRPLLLSGLLFATCGAFWVGCGGSESSGPVVTVDAGKSDATVPPKPVVDSGPPVVDQKDATTTDMIDASKPIKDAGPPFDANGVRCGTATTCDVGQQCCVTANDAGGMFTCAASCPDAGFTLACDGPEDCKNGGGPLCCANLKTLAGTSPNCPLDSVATACVTTCTTTLSQMCPGKTTVRLCHQPEDCAGEVQHTSCCTRGQGALAATFCLSPTIAGFIGATCL